MGCVPRGSDASQVKAKKRRASYSWNNAVLTNEGEEGGKSGRQKSNAEQ